MLSKWQNRSEENDGSDWEIPAFTTMATMWINGEDRGGRDAKKTFDQTGTNA